MDDPQLRANDKQATFGKDLQAFAESGKRVIVLRDKRSFQRI